MKACAPGRGTVAHPCLGATLLELAVVMAVTLAIGAAVLLLLGPVHDVLRREGEANDARQRLRVAAEAFRRSLRQAGAGVDGAAQTGPLVHYLPPVLPRGVGLWMNDSAFSAFSDRLTVIAAPDAAVQAPLILPMLVPWAPIGVGSVPGCPRGRPACGLRPGSHALIFDRTGAWDFIVVTGVAGPFVSYWPPLLSKAYDPEEEAQVTAADLRVLYHDRARRQLRQYDGHRSDLPVVDDVVGLELRYLVDPAPPRSPLPPLDEANCIAYPGGLPRLPALGPVPGPLVELPPARFADGPFCGGLGNRWDADLLRVRAVHVRLRVQAADPAVRGADRRLFVNPGHAVRSRSLVADMQWEFQVAPRNLNVGR